MKKYILGLIVLLIVAGGLYFKFGSLGKGENLNTIATSTLAVADVGQRVYRNEQYGFSLSYNGSRYYETPGDFIYRKTVVTILAKADDPCSKCDFRSYVSVGILPATTTLDKFTHGGYGDYFDGNNRKVQSVSAFKLNNTSAYLIKFLLDDVLFGEVNREVFFVAGGKYTYFIEYAGADWGKPIAKTFKLI